MKLLEHSLSDLDTGVDMCEYDSSKIYFTLIGVDKSIQNYELIKLLYIRRYGDRFTRLEPKVYERYIDKVYRVLTLKIPTTAFNTVKALKKSKELYDTQYTLKTLLEFYENKEEFEKCIYLRDLINTIK